MLVHKVEGPIGDPRRLVVLFWKGRTHGGALRIAGAVQFVPHVVAVRGQIVAVRPHPVVLGEGHPVKAVPGEGVVRRLGVDRRRWVGILDRFAVRRPLPLRAKVHLARAIGGIPGVAQDLHQRHLGLG